MINEQWYILVYVHFSDGHHGRVGQVGRASAAQSVAFELFIFFTGDSELTWHEFALLQQTLPT